MPSRLDAEAMELRLKAIERHVDEQARDTGRRLQALENDNATAAQVSGILTRLESMEAQASLLLKAQQPKPMRRGVVAPQPQAQPVVCAPRVAPAAVPEGST